MRQHLADYYACITSLDHHLGRILQALKQIGRLDQTLIIFSSDQGLAVGGRHGLMGKQNLYEHFKSPLIIAGPGVPHRKSEALVYLFDIYPTVCELCGIRVPKDCDGISLVPILLGKTENVRDTLFAVYMDTQRMVRETPLETDLVSETRPNTMEMFDLQDDPHELRNLAGHPDLAERLAHMKSSLRHWQVSLLADNKVPPLKN